MTKFKKGLSDKVRSKLKNKTKTSTTANPFEIKVNKVKHNVVNKKVQKWEKGLPGVSRSKAIKKRKDTILNELHHMKKSNVLHDKRIGEKDSNLTAEEKMVQRFALERKMQTNKQSAFNLNDEEEVLTHYGQSLAENLKDRPGSDSDDDDYFADKESAGKFQFGGFNNDSDGTTWKDKMNEVIMDSKKHKYERQQEKEKSYEATKELDSTWKSVVDKMAQKRKDAPARAMSNFMMLSRSLVMEQKSDGATDKFKTEEQRAREEAERLKKLEAQRLERMKGKEEKNEPMDHISADSLTNGYAVNKKGKLKVSFAGDSDESDDEEEEAEEEESDDDDDESGNDEDEYSDLEDNEDNSEEDEGSDDEESNEEEDDNEKSNSENHKSILKKTLPPPIVKDPKSGKIELPFVFEAPQTYDELKVLLHGHSTADQLTIVSRLIKCHHSSLAESNKETLQNIHMFLLQYVGERVQEKELDVKLMDGLASHLWELTQKFPSATAKFLQDIVLEEQKHYMTVLEKRGGRGLFPSIDTLMYLRLVEILFPTSDFRHQVTTPAIHFMAQMLAESSVKSLKDVICGLYLCALCIQYVQSSKRYVPEVVTFLHGVVYLASGEDKNNWSHSFPPFRKVNKETCQLELKKKCDEVSSQLSLSQMILSASDDQGIDKKRCDVINTCVDLISICMTVWNNLPCLHHIMKPIDKQLKCLPTHLFPRVLKDKVENLSSQIVETKNCKLMAMQHESKKPEPLMLFEPKVQENWSGRHKKGGVNRDVNSRQRMLHKYKREMKSAVREIKRDNAVVAQHKLDVTLKKDAERKRKVKEIMSSLSHQEGDYKAIKRGKPL